MGFSIPGTTGERKEAMEEVAEKALGRVATFKTICVALEVANTEKKN